MYNNNILTDFILLSLIIYTPYISYHAYYIDGLSFSNLIVSNLLDILFVF